MWRIKIVEQEKQRLLQEHVGYLQGFLHPELVEQAKVLLGFQDTRGQSPNYQQRCRQ